jgi:hypothetical protein
VPVEFLTDEQAAAFGRFTGEPSRAELERFFFLADTDRELIGRYRGEHNRLGFAVQLGTVRYLGTFLADPVDVPWAVIEYMAGQLDVVDASVVKRYTERAATQWEHAAEIRKTYGYSDFSGTEVAQRFGQFMAGRAWTHAEGPYQLFGQATAWLRQHRVLLPGASVLARQVAAVRQEAADRVHRTLADAAAAADPGLAARLAGLLEVPTGQRSSGLDQLRRPPRRRSGRAMVKALDRVAEVMAIGAGKASTEPVPANRLETLARYGLAGKAPALRALAEPRRTATLLATARHLEATAVDDAVDLFDVLMATRLISEARRASAAERTAALPRLERASATLASAWRALQPVLEAAKDGMVNVPAAWAAIEKVASRDQVQAAAAVVEQLVPDAGSEDAAMRESLAAKYGVVRPFLELLAERLPLHAVPAGQELLAEVRRLPVLARRRVNARRLRHDEVNADLVTGAWQRAVYHNRDLPAGAVDRDAYVLCVLEQLHRKLLVRDIFARPSVRWADPRAQLLGGTEWQAVRGEVLAGLGLDQPVEAHLAEAAAGLDAAWQLLARRLEEAGPDASVRVVPDGDRVKLSIERLEGVGEPPSLVALRDTVDAMLPRVDLPDLLLEVHAWTGFLDEYTHIGGLAARMDDLPVSVAALLVAEACNVGLTPVVKPSVPALTRDRL